MQNYDIEIENLLSKMSLIEKIGQLNQLETPTEDKKEYFKENIRKGKVGSILMSIGATAGNDAQGAINVDFYNELQRIAIEESPSGIPLLMGRDVIHGHRTVFPIPLAMAASFNTELIKKSYIDIAVEASNESVHWTFTPMLDLCRDPRWGRVIEGTGEDPFLGSQIARAIVEGLQGEDPSDENKMLSCAKHFIGYGASEGGRDYHRTEISDYSLYNYYLPAFSSAIDAGVATVMSAFNDINGQPVTSSKHYLTDILRKKLGFDGLVVSDYDAVIQLERQGVSENNGDSAKLALNAGIDIDMHSNVYLNELEKLVNNNEISIKTIDNAVRRVLRAKFAKGLFENPYCKKNDYNRLEHLKDAREMAAESMVLLKNNDKLLPLNKDSNIALVGPFAKERRSLLGSWTIDGKEEETENFEEALRKKCKGNVLVSKGVGLEYNTSLSMMEKSDTVILALGESWTSTGESRSVSDISISKDQLDLIKNAKSTGKKVVGVFFCGRPIAMQNSADELDAVIYAWHSGSETAGALCDILFGDVVPSGKLPMTIPRMATHIPLYYNVTSSGRPVNCYYNENAGDCYVDSIPTPYYPFGYGLSYSQFDYGKINCKKDSISYEDIKKGEIFEITVEINNIGNFDAKETVQLYIHDSVAEMMRPIRELKAFKKIWIKKGTKSTVQFDIGLNELGYYNNVGEYRLEKGTIEVFVGSNCLTENKIDINIV